MATEKQTAFDAVEKWFVVTDAGTRDETVYRSFFTFEDAKKLADTDWRLDVMTVDARGFLTAEF